jgi:hypothetical protein
MTVNPINFYTYHSLPLNHSKRPPKRPKPPPPIMAAAASRNLKLHERSEELCIKERHRVEVVFKTEEGFVLFAGDDNKYGSAYIPKFITRYSRMIARATKDVKLKIASQIAEYHFCHWLCRSSKVVSCDWCEVECDDGGSKLQVLIELSGFNAVHWTDAINAPLGGRSALALYAKKASVFTMWRGKLEGVSGIAVSEGRIASAEHMIERIIVERAKKH